MRDETNERADRLFEAAMAVLQGAPGGQMNIVSLNKALFYLDLYALRDTGKTVTHSPYVALEQGPVVAKYPKRLVERLVASGFAEQLQIDKAKPLRLMKKIDHFRFLDGDQIALAGDLARFAAGMTSGMISKLSHENPGWEIAYDEGLKHGGKAKPIDMVIALQQLTADDPWLEEAPSEDLVASMEEAADEVGQPW